MEDSQVHRHRSDYNKTSLLHYVRRRALWALGKRSPFLAYLKVTNRCNLDCYYCPWHTRPDNFEGELKTDTWISILHTLASRGVRIFVFEGGEPTLRSDLPILLDEAHALGASTVLATNAVRTPWQYRPTAFTTSIDGPQEIHDGARGAGTYSKVLRSLQKRTATPVVSITVVSSENKDHLATLCEEISTYVDAMLFTFLYPYSSRPVTTALSPSEVVQVKKELLRLKKSFPILNPSTHLKPTAKPWRCYDELTLSVDYTGTIHGGCFVEHVEPKNCANCELSCFQLISAFYQFNLEAWFNLNRFLLRAI